VEAEPATRVLSEQESIVAALAQSVATALPTNKPMVPPQADDVTVDMPLDANPSMAIGTDVGGPERGDPERKRRRRRSRHGRRNPGGASSNSHSELLDEKIEADATALPTRVAIEAAPASAQQVDLAAPNLAQLTPIAAALAPAQNAVTEPPAFLAAPTQAPEPSVTLAPSTAPTVLPQEAVTPAFADVTPNQRVRDTAQATGLQWVETDPARYAQTQIQNSAEQKPPRLGRVRKSSDPATQQTLVQVETQNHA
jgi:ribonuclease E